MGIRPLPTAFFNRDARTVARELIGKVVAHRTAGHWLRASIVEAEAYYREERGSHASLGFTPKRQALFMPPGTLYLYYARGGDSLNVSCRGEGNAVLIKGGRPWSDPAAGEQEAAAMLEAMQLRNPLPGGRRRPGHRLCAGQTLLCRALGIKVPDWDQKALPQDDLTFLDVGYRPERLLRTPRLGIPPGRDEHLPYRFVDPEHSAAATRNPLTRDAREGRDYDWVRV